MITISKTLDQAIAAPGEIRAGGTDVQERHRHEITHGGINDISRLNELTQITWNDDNSVTIGANVTIDAVSRDPRLMERYSGLTTAAGALATPQIRAMASMGGALLQRIRCWYFRHPDFSCYKKGGDSCPARDGDHRYGVCFDLGPCAFPHPSTLGMTLMTYDAMVRINGSDLRSITDIYGDGSDPTRDHLLDEHEVLTEIILPPVDTPEHTGYFRSISRARAEWPLVEVSVRYAVDDQNVIQSAGVGIGGVATIPLRLKHVEAVLIGQPASDETFEKAAIAATEGASPLPMTEYKVKLVYGTVYETLQRAKQGIRG